jgi:hypothetical protein
MTDGDVTNAKAVQAFGDKDCENKHSPPTLRHVGIGVDEGRGASRCTIGGYVEVHVVVVEGCNASMMPG